MLISLSDIIMHMTIIKKYPIPAQETAALRYERDYKNIPILDTAGNPDDRHDRTLLQQAQERKSRRFVTDNISAVTGGAPIFGSDSSTPGGGNGLPAPLWVDNFQGPELGPEWTLHAGEVTFAPLSSAGETVQLARLFNVANYQIDFVGDFSSGMAAITSSGLGPTITPTATSVYVSDDGPIEKMLAAPARNITVKHLDGVYTLIINGETIAEESVTAMVGENGEDSLNVTLMSDEGSPAPTISSITLYDLSD